LQQISLNKQLVLIGGGHSNVQVLRKLCMHQYKGLNVILISESYGAIYSGMTPGYIEKLYSLDESLLIYKDFVLMQEQLL
jgi:NADH dehydrogenase FAD-containing subunit